MNYCRSVLIVDDEPTISEVIKAYMEKDGWNVEVAYDADIAIAKFTKNIPDLVILDIMLGATSGEELSQKIRARSNIPFIMITSKSREEDRLNGFELGADDYVVKPFSPKELLARANAVYRRSLMYITKIDEKQPKLVTYGSGHLLIDYQKMIVYVNGQDTNLTNTEYKLFSALTRAPEKVFTRAELLYYAQGYRFVGDPRIIDAHVKNIRQKVEQDPKSPKILLTVVGAGYKLGLMRDEN
ncbi:response regulator transcription factor [Paenibacillus spongiae]|uniref:Response regulator transcription factor n=1 Tax=Paenibacillus spongiae TaxID=2909671 RepID=A0ABY5SFJ5_9BACL|nr:response regulator transcription factor [Paenibacillus spongiae]UVI31443.1 response regulator transcription factor [Paenibacillus spongiae]